MTDLRTLHNISAPPKGRARSDLIWDHTDQSILFRDLVQYLGMMISPALRAEIEERLPGVNIGDIKAGHVLLVRNREVPDGFEFEYSSETRASGTIAMLCSRSRTRSPFPRDVINVHHQPGNPQLHATQQNAIAVPAFEPHQPRGHKSLEKRRSTAPSPGRRPHQQAGAL